HLMTRRPPRPTPFPYTTLFRSLHDCRASPSLAPAFRTRQVTSRRVLGGAAPAALRSATVRLGRRMSVVVKVWSADWLSCWHVSLDRKSTRLNSSHVSISYAVFC